MLVDPESSYPLSCETWGKYGAHGHGESKAMFQAPSPFRQPRCLKLVQLRHALCVSIFAPRYHRPLRNIVWRIVVSYTRLRSLVLTEALNSGKSWEYFHISFFYHVLPQILWLLDDSKSSQSLFFSLSFYLTTIAELDCMGNRGSHPFRCSCLQLGCHLHQFYLDLA